MSRRKLSPGVSAVSAMIAAGCIASGMAVANAQSDNPSHSAAAAAFGVAVSLPAKQPLWVTHCMPASARPIEGYAGLPLRRAAALAVTRGYEVERAVGTCVVGNLVFNHKPVIAFSTNQRGLVDLAYTALHR